MQRILLALDGDPQPSVFDAVVAIDAGAEQLLRHGGVRPQDVRDLVYGAIFTRGPADLKNTALFVGGSDVAAGEALLRAAVESFVGPMRISAMLDANGCNTTAAAAVLAAARHVVLSGAIVTVLAGTGPVGSRVARLLAREGARVRVGSRKLTHAEATCDKVSRGVGAADLTPMQTDTAEATLRAVAGAQAVIACGPPGVQVLAETAWSKAGLQAAIDLNAVPPAGVAGVEPMDKGTARHGVACHGALGVGGVKMKIHKAAIAKLFTANNLVLDAEEIFAIGKQLEVARK